MSLREGSPNDLGTDACWVMRAGRGCVSSLSDIGYPSAGTLTAVQVVVSYRRYS